MAGALDGWAERINVWRAEGRDAFAYFNNDEMGYAPEERAPPARARLGLTVADDTSGTFASVYSAPR
jgi:uncharacterized protein YecE (DUF72 family)